jgi:hypothetical protein
MGVEGDAVSFGYKPQFIAHHCCVAITSSYISLLSFHFSRIIPRKAAKEANTQSFVFTSFE